MKQTLSLAFLGIVLLACAHAAEEEVHPPKGKANRLANEKSIYLQQHARNPVDWFPWGDEAFEKAKNEGKPVFLSIGYSTCHWCHVMERESFENDEIANYLNDHFISIKVDREERPDVDSIYMSYVQALRGNGGWPLTTFLNPDDRVPFWGGTYFPPISGPRGLGFLEVLRELHTQWEKDRDVMIASADRVMEVLQAQTERHGVDKALSVELFKNVFQSQVETFDAQYGGSRGAPKFPAPMLMSFLLRHEEKTGNSKALEMVTKTLHSMADGGIYDQVGGGFSRYAVDEQWRVPHFEKMLYTQGLLARLYAEAWQRTHDPRFEEIARGTLDYVLRDMHVMRGGLAAAEDADSEGEEGLFYTWTPDELIRVLGQELGSKAATAFGVTQTGNVDGRSVLHRAAIDTLSAEQLQTVTSKLFDARSKRVRPLRDDKVLTAWNGLAISAFAFCGRVFNERRYIEAAQGAASFVRDRLIVDGELRRSWRLDEVGGHAFLDDYAFYARSLLDLYEADFDVAWLDLGTSLTRDAIARFGDEASATFFDAPAGLDDLIVRPRAAHDGALPSATAVLVSNMIRISDWQQDDELKERALACIASYVEPMTRSPLAFGELVNAAMWGMEPPREVVFAGSKRDVGLHRLVTAYYQDFRPHRVIAYAPLDEPELAKRFPLIDGKVPVRGLAAVYLCEDYTCRAPITDATKLRVN